MDYYKHFGQNRYIVIVKEQQQIVLSNNHLYYIVYNLSALRGFFALEKSMKTDRHSQLLVLLIHLSSGGASSSSPNNILYRSC
jgi:hypothetical protein